MAGILAPVLSVYVRLRVVAQGQFAVVGEMKFGSADSRGLVRHGLECGAWMVMALMGTTEEEEQS